MKTLLSLILFLFIFESCQNSLQKKVIISSAKGGELLSKLDLNSIYKIVDNIDEDFKFEIEIYKLSYFTKDDNGNIVKASGVAVIPTSGNSRFEEINIQGYSVVVDCHSTIFINTKAPSLAINSVNSLYSAILFSSKYGFITLQPDYIGFGDSVTHYHPYLLQQSSANSVVDFYKEFLKFAEVKGLVLSNSGLYLTGYSQGAYIALASLPRFEKEGIKVKITAPMDGIYILAPIIEMAFKYRYNPYPSYLTALLYSYSKVYNLPLDNFIKEPYKSLISTLFNGAYSRKEIDRYLTTKRDKIFLKSFIENFRESKLYFHLLENSVVDFLSYSKIDFVHCKGDNTIPIEFTKYTLKAFKGIGTKNVNLTQVEDYFKLDKELNHKACAPFAYKIVAKKFDKIKNKNKVNIY